MDTETTKSTANIDYQAKYLEIIKEKVLANIDVDNSFVFLFGSRAIGKGTRTSDVDIGILDQKPIGQALYRIANSIDESIVPYKVDVVDFILVDPKFREKVFQEDIVVWNRPKNWQPKELSSKRP